MNDHDRDDGALVSLLALVDNMQDELESDVRSFPASVEHARNVIAAGGYHGSLAENLRQVILSELDSRVHDLDHRQQHVLRLVDEAIAGTKVADEGQAGDDGVWAPAWQPPDVANEDNRPVPIRQAVSPVDRHRRQLVQVLTIAGVLLVACGVLLGIL